MKKLSITCIILAYNEEVNIEKSIMSVIDLVEEVYVVDSFSTDKTLEIAEKYGAKILQNKFVNYSYQYKWALKEIDFKTQWVMRLDADEYVTPGLKKKLANEITHLDKDITGIVVNRKIYFMKKWIKHGGMYPVELLRFWKVGKATIEERFMDEHVELLEGKTLKIDEDIVDSNNKDFTWWMNKHNSYSNREALDYLNLKYSIFSFDKQKGNLENQAKNVRELKKIYYKMPIFLRPFIYYFYRVIFCLGFLDGLRGAIWHLFQGLFYRLLVDVKIYEIQLATGNDKSMVINYVEENFPEYKNLLVKNNGSF